MKLFCLGINHHTAPVEVRERLAFREEDIPEALASLRGTEQVSEAVIVSTCNRVEVYGTADDLNAGLKCAFEFLTHYHGVDLEKERRHFYSHTGLEAVCHLFRVCASLDSLIVGEAQILGQAKEAYRLSAEADATGTVMNRVFHKAFTAAKRVRTETEIGRKPVNVSYAAVDLAEKIFESLKGRRALLVGAGEMAELAAQHLLSQGAEDLLIANRTRERSEALAESLGGTVIDFNDYARHLASVDIVICSAAAPHFVIGPNHVAPALRTRKARPMFFIDISVPRNIDPAINDINGAYYYDIDDLELVVRSNRKEREREMSTAEEILDGELASMAEWVQSLQYVPTITAIRHKADAIAREELDRTLKNLGDISMEDRAHLERMTSAIVSKLLHEPIRQLKAEARTAGSDDGDAAAAKPRDSGLVHTVRRLFGIDED